MGKDVRKSMFVLLTGLFLSILTACGSDNENEASSDEKLQVVTSFTIIEDLAREIGGEHVDVYNLVPTGTDPHEYEPLPEDTKHVADADVLFYNGFNLEGGENGWFFKLIDSVDQDEDRIFSLTEQVEPMYIGGEEGGEEEVNPHSFIDPVVGMTMAEEVRDALIEIQPEYQEDFETQTDAYLDKLKAIDEEYQEKINDIPEDKQILVTSERAFQYLVDRYGLDESYIWEIDTEENGSPEQISALVNFIDEHDVPTLFVESNVDTRPMETVSEESGVPIFEDPIYSDEIGKKGEDVDTYLKYLEYNIQVIHDGLSQ